MSENYLGTFQSKSLARRKLAARGYSDGTVVGAAAWEAYDALEAALVDKIDACGPPR